MPKRTDLKRVLIIGSGPIVIGQACEFDYSGSQACKALRAEGLEVILVNSNPATIMTDPELADRTYVEPLTTEVLEAIIAIEKPDAILPTVGGQTALNLAVDLHNAGMLEKYNVKLIGASIEAIRVAEDRLLFKDAMREIGLDVPMSGLARSLDEAMNLARTLGFPLVIRPSFTLGGVGGGIAYNIEEFRELAERGVELSPVHEVLVEESVIGWKEFELEVMRDVADNFVVICSIENIDPMGVHTGDSITVAPILTLSDKEYQRMRDAARLIIRRVGVETGGSNIQFAVNPADGRMVVIEMNPRVSRSSALASKATGFPIAKIAAKLALGYHLDEIPNDITRLTPASFEPTIDYVVVKIPRWNFEKFPQADRTLTTQMKSVGEAMAIGRTFKEAFMKGVRSLELGRSGLLFAPATGDRTEGIAGTEGESDTALRKRLAVPNDRRMWDIFRALDRGWTIEQVQEPTRMDPWFLRQFAEIVELKREAAKAGLDGLSPELLRRLKRAGFGDQEIALAVDSSESAVRERRTSQALAPVYKRVDTCAAEFESFTPYLYSSYEPTCESNPNGAEESGHPRQRAEPDRTGHRVRLLLLPRRLRAARRRLRNGDDQLQPGNRVHRLRHGRSVVLSAADVRRRDGRHRNRAVRRRRGLVPRAVRRPDAAQARAGAAARRRRDSGHLAGLDRPRRRSRALRGVSVRAQHHPAEERRRHVARGSARSRRVDRVSGGGAAVLRARRTRHGDRLRRGHARPVHDARG